MWRRARRCQRARRLWTSGTSRPGRRIAQCAWCAEIGSAGAGAVWHEGMHLLVMPALKTAAAPCCSQRHSLRLVQEMDVPRFWDLLIGAIHAADQRSPLNSGGGK